MPFYSVIKENETVDVAQCKENGALKHYSLSGNAKEVDM